MARPVLISTALHFAKVDKSEEKRSLLLICISQWVVCTLILVCNQKKVAMEVDFDKLMLQMTLNYRTTPIQLAEYNRLFSLCQEPAHPKGSQVDGTSVGPGTPAGINQDQNKENQQKLPCEFDLTSKCQAGWWNRSDNDNVAPVLLVWIDEPHGCKLQIQGRSLQELRQERLHHHHLPKSAQAATNANPAEMTVSRQEERQPAAT
uniref:Uncharacterized protein n=1 Tax=Plectus sambesii TaxID=2011161 RepID=A0A914VHZ1_9BILA